MEKVGDVSNSGCMSTLRRCAAQAATQPLGDAAAAAVPRCCEEICRHQCRGRAATAMLAARGSARAALLQWL
jgi:hypothetical protein